MNYFCYLVMQKVPNVLYYKLQISSALFLSFLDWFKVQAVGFFGLKLVFLVQLLQDSGLHTGFQVYEEHSCKDTFKL